MTFVSRVIDEFDKFAPGPVLSTMKGQRIIRLGLELGGWGMGVQREYAQQEQR